MVQKAGRWHNGKGATQHNETGDGKMKKTSLMVLGSDLFQRGNSRRRGRRIGRRRRRRRMQ